MPGAGGGVVGRCVMGTEFQFSQMKSSSDGWWGWLDSTVDVLRGTDPDMDKWLRG